MNLELEAKTVTFMGRPALRIGNGLVRATVDLDGGMVSEFGLEQREGFLNLHWIPPFRETSGRAFETGRDAPFWKSRLLFGMAGNFVCSPSFGPDCVVDGAKIPAHGWTANAEWRLVDYRIEGSGKMAYGDFALESPDPAMPLRWTRRDFVISGQGALFSALSIRNTGAAAIGVNVAQHNMVGAPFLEPGCRIGLCAEDFMTAPVGTEFDATGRLAPGAGFDSLSSAPLRSGATTDLSLVPGMVGATDFVTGSVPTRADLGWSSVLNPRLGLAYLCLFPGPKSLPEGEISLSFNDLWMQYGGRNFLPWAESEGGKDRSFCLGTENAVGAYASGLGYSREHPELLGRPTLVTIPAGGERRLFYATAVLPLGPLLRQAPLTRVEAIGGSLLLGSGRATQSLPLSADFELPRLLCRGMP